MIAALLLSLALAAGPDPAQLLGPPAGPALEGAALRTQTHDTTKMLRCVVCQGLSVADSPSETARAMRDEVEALVAKGYDTEQVLFYFEASYGEFVRMEPKAEGFNLLVWGMPVAFLLAGGGIVFWSMRPRAKRVDVAEDEYLRRVREETK